MKKKQVEKREEAAWNETTSFTIGDKYYDGTKMLSYNMDTKEYSTEHIPYGFLASASDEVGAIIYFTSAFHEETLIYDSKEEQWQMEPLTIMIVERGSGKTIAEREFVAEPYKRVSVDAEQVCYASGAISWIEDT